MSPAARRASRKVVDALATGLICVAAACLLIGATFPVAAKLANPFLAYGIVFVSLPAWAISAFAGGTVVWRASRRQQGNRVCFLLGVTLLLGNALAAVVVLIIPFHAS